MRRRIADHVDELIARHRLHDGELPVDLSPLETEFVPLDQELAGAGARAYAVPPRGGEVTGRSPAYVVVDARRVRHERRVLYAHEVGHLLCGHPGSLRSLGVADWFHDRDEREAWEVAAALLIPRDAWVGGATPADVAASCHVPVWLAERYPRARC